MIHRLPEHLKTAVKEFLLAYLRTTKRVIMPIHTFVKNAEKAIKMNKFGLFYAISQTMEALDESGMAKAAIIAGQGNATAKSNVRTNKETKKTIKKSSCSDIISIASIKNTFSRNNAANCAKRIQQRVEPKEQLSSSVMIDGKEKSSLSSKRCGSLTDLAMNQSVAGKRCCSNIAKKSAEGYSQRYAKRRSVCKN